MTFSFMVHWILQVTVFSGQIKKNEEAQQKKKKQRTEWCQKDREKKKEYLQSQLSGLNSVTRTEDVLSIKPKWV